MSAAATAGVVNSAGRVVADPQYQQDELKWLAADSSRPISTPLCLVLMPMTLGRDVSGRKVDFPALYETVIIPAIRDSGFEPILANQRRGPGFVDRESIEQLWLCDFVIADVSDGNPRIAYQVGVRHALRPSGTAIMCLDTATCSFYDLAAEITTYRVEDFGKPLETVKLRAALKSKLLTTHDGTEDDSPIFRFSPDLPRYRPDYRLVGRFRAQEQYSVDILRQIDKAAREDKPALLALAGNPILPDLSDSANVMAQLIGALRSVGAYVEVIGLFDRLPSLLQRMSFFREELAYALHQLGESNAAALKLEALVEEAPNSTSYALLGRVYKDLWTTARSRAQSGADSILRQAIQAYLEAFQFDWRDAYPGVNAVTLMGLQERPDPRLGGLLPVLRYAAVQSAEDAPEYWDYATLLELAVLSGDHEDASKRLAEALGIARANWELDSTTRILDLIRGAKQARGEPVEWIMEIEKALNGATPAR
jgi:tetratricopeptide (TPR) repeat protein